MQEKLTQQQKAFIKYLLMKWNELLDFVIGEKATPTSKESKEVFDPLIFFSRRQIKRKVYRSFRK